MNGETALVIESSAIDGHGKPDWCPIRDLPAKKFDVGNEEGLYTRDYRYGWNECIDEILKGDGAE